MRDKFVHSHPQKEETFKRYFSGSDEALSNLLLGFWSLMNTLFFSCGQDFGLSPGSSLHSVPLETPMQIQAQDLLFLKHVQNSYLVILMRIRF